ncbi:MAG: acetyl-CoA carboxylase biotin carboxylase subunit [Carbonactinosporaceae bacterium]
MRRLLIANRGEIAVRVARAARDEGIETVGVHSAADRGALHATIADRSICIGPAPASDSYLRREVLVHVAEATGCDAVHPGYGFLSEDARFAEQVREAGLLWVGPRPETIRQMGDKAAARTAAARADVPVVPGSTGVLAGVDEVSAFARDHGLPLLLKARSGGGGKGMRVVPDGHELASVFMLARQEAAAAFGDDALYVERYLPAVRHVEVQVLADSAGHVRALGERDCSLQRRHQKVLEEAPAVRLPAERREAMCAAAVRLAEAVGYTNAGTVEFLVDVHTGAFFFIEMNTRIQVEHPVTEETTGVDLVTWQLRLARGEELGRLGRITPAGHAMEFRVTAEDGFRGFTPSPGRLTRFDPPAGPGVRCDTHCFPGYVVPPYYDSLLAKLVVRGGDRDEVIRRARRALHEFRIEGVPATLELHRWLLEQPGFVAGGYSTHYLTDALAGRQHNLGIR